MGILEKEFQGETIVRRSVLWGWLLGGLGILGCTRPAPSFKTLTTSLQDEMQIAIICQKALKELFPRVEMRHDAATHQVRLWTDPVVFQEAGQPKRAECFVHIHPKPHGGGFLVDAAFVVESWLWEGGAYRWLPAETDPELEEQVLSRLRYHLRQGR